MKFRMRAFGLHLAGSACVLGLVLGGFYFLWYRWPGWYLSGVLGVVLVMCLVDVAVGPSLTLVVANPHKARDILKRDIAVIVAAQAAALVYGTITLWIGRPLYYTYSNKSLDMVQASDLEADEVAQALKDNPAFAPHWYSGVRWVWAPLPAEAAAGVKIAGTTAFGDVVDMPRYFKPWTDGLPELRRNLRPISDVVGFSKAEKVSLAHRMVAKGISPAQPNAMVMWGEEGTRPLLTVFDPQSLEVRAMLRVHRRQ